MSVGLAGSVAVLLGTTVGVVVHGVLPELLAGAIVVCSLASAWPTRTTVMVALSVAAAAHGACARERALEPVPRDLITTEPVEVAGVIASDAVRTPAGVRLDLTINERRVRVVVTGTLADDVYGDWTRGRTLVAPMRLRQPELVRNPGAPSPAWQVLTRRFDLIGTVKSAALVECLPGPWWEDVAARIRAHVRTTTRTWLAPRAPTSAAVVTAILIGDRAGLDEQVTRRLQAAGTFHVIAISGGNVAMLAMVCLVGMRLATRSLVTPLVVTAITISAYGIVVGPEPSVIRALVAAVLYLLLRLNGMSPQPLNLLATVAVVCVVWDPLTVTDVGTWLSFGATFGLIVILPRLVATARGPLVPTQAQGWGRVRDWARTACLATVAAEIVILPITAAVFSRVGVAGLVLNLVAIPAMVIAQLAGLLLCLWTAFSATGASLVAALAHYATVVLLGSAAAMDVAPWLSWRVPPSSLWWVSAYYAAVLCALGWRRRGWRRGAVAVAAASAAVLVTSPFVGLNRPASGWLRVSVLDVGQGDAVLVQTPSRHALLVDAGGTPSGTFDVGGRVVAPAVWALGERRIDWLALSHGDLDHIGGARRVVEDLRPREVWEGIPVAASAPLQAIRAEAQSRGVVWRRLSAGHDIEVGAVSIVVRHPAVPDWERIRVRNDDSLVLEIRYGEVAVLLTGDAGPEFEAAEPGTTARIRVIKVAHHGSQSSTSGRWLDAFDPRAALISTGAGNLFGHPSPQVLARLAARGAHTFRTDRHGALIVESDGRGVHVRGLAGPRLAVF